MQTRFDHISDDDVLAAYQSATTYGFNVLPYELWQEGDLEKIGRLVLNMYYWKSWIGPPVTFFDESGLNYDGHHRVRACKYIARRLGFQIHIPVRYDPIMREPDGVRNKAPCLPSAATEVKQMKNDKDYRAPCSQDCICGSSPPSVGDTICQ